MTSQQQKKASRKARAIELASQYRPVRLIAEELGCTRQTVWNYLKEYRDELPAPGYLTRLRLHIGMAEADNPDLVLRIAAIQRHYETTGPHALADSERFVVPDITTPANRMAASHAVLQAVADGKLTPSQGSVMFTGIKEGSGLDGLAGELQTLREMEVWLEGVTDGAYKPRMSPVGSAVREVAAVCG